MFASNPPNLWPKYHALLRCLAPGPLLLSDTPDVKTDNTLLSWMTSNGRSVRTEGTASVLPGRWFWDNLTGQGEGPALVAGVAIPAAQGALLGAWNIRDVESGCIARDEISIRDVEDVLGADEGGLEGEYVLWSVGHSERNKNKFAIVGKQQKSGSLKLELGTGECEVVIVAKVFEIKGKKVAVLGMLDKFATLAGVSVEPLQGRSCQALP
jgi:hypothetical protein